MLRGSYLCSAPLTGQRAGLLLLPGRLHKSFRHGGGRRSPRFVSAPAPAGAGGHGSRTRVSLRRPSVSTGPGRAPGRRHDAGGEEGWGEKGRGENGAGAGSKLRPSPAERRERPSPAGSAQGRRPRPKRDCKASRLPPRSRPASARPWPAAPSTSPRCAEIPQGGGRHQPPCSPGAATFPGAVSVPHGAPGPGLGPGLSPGARAPSSASGLPGLAEPRALSARRAATCPRVAGKARR